MKKRILPILAAVVVLATVLCVPALAITEAEVEAQVAASGKGAVTGNVLIWFLCAVAFLKVSQKIDSFLSVLGVNVGNTGGSMLGDAMVAMRTVSMMVGGGRAAAAGRAGASSGGTAGQSGTTAGTAGFFKGGLVGMAGRHITNSAVKTATTQTSAVHTAQQSAVHTAAHSQARQAGTAANAANANPGGSSIPTGGVSASMDSASVPMGGVSDPIGGASPAPVPPQERTIHTGSEAPPSVPTSGSVPPAPEPVSYSSSPPQEGIILTGSETPPSVPSSGPVPPVSGPVSHSGPPPQEGTILTGNEAQPSIPQSGATPQTTGPVSNSNPISGLPSQEGTILAGSEAPASMPQPDSAPESIGFPPESAPADVTPPQEGIIVTGGESTVHAPQTENIFAGGAEGTAHVENTAVSGNGQHTQTHTERSTQTARTTASSERVQTSRFHSAGATAFPTLGGMVFSHSLASGGSFANDVIGTVARGEVAGSITGDMAAQSLSSYMGYATPGLLPKRKTRQSSEFLLDPFNAALGRYVQEHPVPRFRHCAVCFCSVYDRALPKRRIRDYDNLELKQLLDVAAAYLLVDDSGLLCDTYNTTELGDTDCTRIVIMESTRFPAWMNERQATLEPVQNL